MLRVLTALTMETPMRQAAPGSGTTPARPAHRLALLLAGAAVLAVLSGPSAADTPVREACGRAARSPGAATAALPAAEQDRAVRLYVERTLAYADCIDGLLDSDQVRWPRAVEAEALRDAALERMERVVRRHNVRVRAWRAERPQTADAS